MRLAFYCPFRAPGSREPSGAAETARQLIHALSLTGHQVEIASIFCSADAGDVPGRRDRLAGLGERLAGRLIARLKRRPPEARPEAWITYHAGDDAIDRLGPRVAAALDIPLVLIEPMPPASAADAALAGDGDDDGDDPTAAALAQAEAVVTLTRHAAAGLAGRLPDPARHTAMLPFLALGPVEAARKARVQHREALATRYQLSKDVPWLLSVGMMRDADKLKSYEILATSLQRMAALDWRLIVVGDGPLRRDVLGWLAYLPRGRVHWVGALAPQQMLPLYLACDLYIWPAVHERHGRAILEAQACGLPVVVGQGGAVSDVARDGVTGKFAEAGNQADFANAVMFLLRHENFRKTYATAARNTALDHHGIGRAADTLDEVLSAVAARRATAGGG
ncbi:MAG: glycosyltransferase [Alphaproteobacteria bacterium]|jgi:glycosyltransferase involved in cell wall biosynthesis|nr:glycosyltransferase [Alphaproteobacteria bacterium]